MRRIAGLAVAAVLVLLAFTTWLSHPLLVGRWPTTTPTNQFIYKGPYAEDKVIVMAKIASDDVNWVTSELQQWQHAIYHMEDPTARLHPPVNKGREAMAYLTFIIDHYTILPDIIVFLHPHRAGWPEAWHTDAEDYDNVKSVRSLQLDYVREYGYANMRCIHTPGCPDEIQPFRKDADRKYEMAFADAYSYMFGGNHTTVPETIGAACCAQFAVSAAQVHARPKSDYIRYREWLINTELESDDSGRVMEYLWHIIFGKGPIWCPELTQCWCRQFGRC